MASSVRSPPTPSTVWISPYRPGEHVSHGGHLSPTFLEDVTPSDREDSLGTASTSQKTVISGDASPTATILRRSMTAVITGCQPNCSDKRTNRPVLGRINDSNGRLLIYPYQSFIVHISSMLNISTERRGSAACLPHNSSSAEMTVYHSRNRPALYSRTGIVAQFWPPQSRISVTRGIAASLPSVILLGYSRVAAAPYDSLPISDCGSSYVKHSRANISTVDRQPIRHRCDLQCELTETP